MQEQTSVKADKSILTPLSREQLSTCKKSELIELVLGQQELRIQAEKKREEDSFEIGGKFIRILNKLFGKSSERSEKKPRSEPAPTKSDVNSKPKNKTLKPSERYPNVEVLDQEVSLDPSPSCECCQKEMTDSGMRDTTEVLTVIPRRYFIKRWHHVTYRCTHCHGGIKTSARVPRIKPGSSYDDATIIDVSLSKYCDLIPIERYAQMAAREGFEGLPPQSLIELTHYLASFLFCVYELIKREVQSAEILYADETSHRMLEGSPKSNWYLWGFSSLKSSYFEYHSTRSGDVASSFLNDSECRYLMTDVYSGYSKAVRDSNEYRQKAAKPKIENIYCNAHARRKFSELSLESDEGDHFIKSYQKIYKLNKNILYLPQSKKVANRKKMKIHFNAIKHDCQELIERVSSKSYEAKAAKYFLNNYDGLTKCIQNPEIPIDNNHQERLLRNPVIGRKTWYGTHSKQGAKTAAILFSIVESCKLNKINPRKYVKDVVKHIHEGKSPYTPRQAAINQLN